MSTGTVGIPKDKLNRRMKKVLFTITAVGVMLISNSLNAQKLEVSSAGQALKGAEQMMPQAQMSQDFSKVKGKLLSAKDYIDQAHAKQEKTNGLKPKDLPRYHSYRSQIYLYYMMMAVSEEDIKTDVEANEEKYGEIIMESARKCRDTDGNGSYWEPLKTKLNIFRIGYAQAGAKMFNEQKYEEAYMAFTSGAEIAEVINNPDSITFYNAGLASERLEKYDEAEKYYGKCVELGYDGAKSYEMLANVQVQQEKMEEATKTLQAGLAKYPGDMGLIRQQLNMHLLAGEYDKAEAAAAKVIEKDPSNPVLHFAIGTIYDELKRYDDAEKSYNKALELDPDYFDALYSKGASYNNQAAEIYSTINEITDVVLQQEESKRADTLLARARPLLERCHKMKPEDKVTMEALKQIYARLGEDELWSEMKKKLENQ